METSAFCTTARIGPGHGGGLVSHHELEALKTISDVKQVISTAGLSLNNYPNNPFMLDYLATLQVKAKVDMAFFNGAPWGATMKALGADYVVVDCPAHNLERSIEEFHRQGLEYPFPHMTDPVLWPLYTKFIREADVVICPSRMSAEYLERNPGTKGKVIIITHGTELPESTPPLPEDFRVGYLGAAGPDKGVPYLLKAWAGLMYQDSELVLAGFESIAPPYTRAKYRFLGQAANTLEFFSNISLYVQPSVTEGFGLPCLEAMAFGRPVVVTEGAGVSELVEDGVEGLVVPIRNPGAIADAIGSLKNSGRLEEMGKAARTKAEQYPWSRIQDEYRRAISDNA